MKILKRLKAYKKEETEGAVLGVGILKAKDYNKDKFGHLLLFSINTKVVQLFKKLFVPI